MDLHKGAVQGYGLDLKPEDLLFLQGSKDPRQHSLFGPAAHAGVNGVPRAEVLGEASPLAAVLCHVQDGVENLEVREADVAALSGEAVFDLAVLCFCDFHWWSIA